MRCSQRCVRSGSRVRRRSGSCPVLRRVRRTRARDWSS
ncbi:MAG: hypothetical protein JJ974_06400, partial [Phycisphaerales bacterium]|nr:hypothetical protein [Phycisphaerales bacterium]